MLKQVYHTLLLEIPHDPLYDIARIMEETISQDTYFVERYVYLNVYFYSELKSFRYPVFYVNVMVAVARSAGWLVHLMGQRDM